MLDRQATGHTHDDFFIDFLDGLGLPTKTAARRALAAVSYFESSQGTLRWFNPLGVVTPMPGSRPLYPEDKGACAQIYPTYEIGVTATCELFSGPHWSAVRKAIRSSLTRGPMLVAFGEAYTWVTPRPVAIFRNHTTKQLDARRAQALLGPL